MNFAIKMGMMPTSHTNAPVAFPNLIMVMWAAVNRISRSGIIIGADENPAPPALFCFIQYPEELLAKVVRAQDTQVSTVLASCL